MQELRRTRSGSFGEDGLHTLHEVQDAAVAARAGDPAALHAMILSVDAAVPDLPSVVIRDAAIDAVCHGAQLAGVGVLSMKDFNKGDTVSVLSQKNEFVCLGKALVPSSSFKPGDTGLVISPTTVFMQPGTYPRGWVQSGKTFPEKKKPDRNPGKIEVWNQGLNGRRTGDKPDRKPGTGHGLRPGKKGYH